MLHSSPAKQLSWMAVSIASVRRGHVQTAARPFLYGFDFFQSMPKSICTRPTESYELYKIGTAPRKIHCKSLKLKVWLPSMSSNHELDGILKSHKLLILKRLNSSKASKEGSWYKIFLATERPV